jgi:hypothetical protein
MLAVTGPKAAHCIPTSEHNASTVCTVASKTTVCFSTKTAVVDGSDVCESASEIWKRDIPDWQPLSETSAMDVFDPWEQAERPCDTNGNEQ